VNPLQEKNDSPSVITLPNGMTVVCQESHRAPVVALQMWVGVGSADEDEAAGEVGLAHVHEHMLFKGTPTRGVGEIARAIEAAGGDINAWTSFDNTVYYVVLASRYFDTGLDVLADALQRSAFDAEELEREREVVLEEIKRSRDIPARIVSNKLFDTAYQVHPYGRPVIGSEESVRALTREQLLAFYQRHYRPERIVMAAVGDFDTSRALAQIEAAFADFEAGAPQLPPRPAEPVQSAPKVQLAFGETQETHLACAWHIPEVGHDDVPALDVLSVVLGHGESSLLSRAVRFRRRLVNDVYAYAYTPRDRGLMIVGATLHHDDLLTATAAVLEETTRLREESVVSREIEKARTIIESEAVYLRETAQGVSRKLGFYQAVLGDLAREQAYYDAVRRVTTDDVRRVARRYLLPEGLTCVSLAPNAAEGSIAQEALEEATQGAFRRRRARPSQTPGRSGAVRAELPSGARVLVLPDHGVPVVSFRMVWLAGQRVEAPASAGVGNLTARLLTKGTHSRTAMEIAHAVDAMAAGLDGFSGRNTVGFYGDFLVRFADQGFDLITDCAHRPAFRDEDLERERSQVLEQIRAREDDLASLTFRLFCRGLYPDHPYRLDPLGTRTSVEALDGDALREHHKRYCATDQAVLAIAGDIDVERALDLAMSGFGDAPPRPGGAVPTPPAQERPDAQRVLRLARDRAQAHIVVGFLGASFHDSDRFALEVLSTTLSGQSGRLFLELRDRRSLAYAVTALSVEGMEPGYFAVYMGTSPEKVDEAVAGVEEQLTLLGHEPPSEEEVARTKRYLIGAHEIGLQRAGARASLMAFDEIYGVGYESHLDYPERIDAVTRDDLARAAQRYLRLDRAVIAIVGPEGCGGPVANLQLDPDEV